MTMATPKRFGQTVFFTERLLAAIIDVAIAFGLTLFPRIGWMFGLIYFLFKDCLPFSSGQSFGRRLFNLKVVHKKDGSSLVGKPDKGLIRQVIFFVPVLNLFEIYYFFFCKNRKGDLWSDTEVVKL